jgi:peptidyl-prolyl isomerase E (cyclophilin E)
MAPATRPRGPSSLYVGGLPASVTDEVLSAVFIPFGELSDVHVATDPATGVPRGFAFVTYVNAEDAVAAIDNIHNNIVHGARILVKRAKERHAAGTRGKALWHEADDDLAVIGGKTAPASVDTNSFTS